MKSIDQQDGQRHGILANRTDRGTEYPPTGQRERRIIHLQDGQRD